MQILYNLKFFTPLQYKGVVYRINSKVAHYWLKSKNAYNN